MQNSAGRRVRLRTTWKLREIPPWPGICSVFCPETKLSFLSRRFPTVPTVSAGLTPAEGPFCLPDPITWDILGIVRSMETNIGVHRFLFQGEPGTGKTEAARWLARLTGRTLCPVDFTSVPGSTPEQAGKALSCLFSRMNHSYTKTNLTKTNLSL